MYPASGSEMERISKLIYKNYFLPKKKVQLLNKTKENISFHMTLFLENGFPEKHLF